MLRVAADCSCTGQSGLPPSPQDLNGCSWMQHQCLSAFGCTYTTLPHQAGMTAARMLRDNRQVRTASRRFLYKFCYSMDVPNMQVGTSWGPACRTDWLWTLKVGKHSCSKPCRSSAMPSSNFARLTASCSGKAGSTWQAYTKHCTSQVCVKPYASYNGHVDPPVIDSTASAMSVQ